jgi:hypothetical protein
MRASGRYSGSGSDTAVACNFGAASNGRQKEHTSWPIVGYPHAGQKSIGTVLHLPKLYVCCSTRYPERRRTKPVRNVKWNAVNRFG